MNRFGVRERENKMTNSYGNELLHKVLLSAMKDIDRICRANGLKYYLYAGALLGAVNYGGFIPWDDDVDIVMFPEDFEKLECIVERDYEKCYRMMTFDNTENWYSKMNKLQIKGAYIVSSDGSKVPVFIDINKLHSVPDGDWQRHKQRIEMELLNLSLSVLSGAVIPTSWRTKLTIAQLSRLGKVRLGNLMEKVLCRYDGLTTTHVGIMCNTLTANPYTGVSGYDTDITERDWHKNPQFLPFEDTKFMTISGYKEDLLHRYGPHYAEPYPEEKRITKHDVKSYEIEPWVLERIK